MSAHASSQPLPDALGPIYAVLRSVSERSETAAAEAAGILEVRLADHRELTQQLRTLLRDAEKAEQKLAEAVNKARAVADPGSEEELFVLRGKRLAAVAVEVLAASDKPQPIHYADWFTLVRDAGHRIGGKDQIATFLTSLSRADGVEAIGARTGLYRLREPA